MKKYTLVLLAVLSSLVLSGCATVPMASKEADDKAKTFSLATNDKASLYIFRDSTFGGALKKKLKIDGQVIGESAPETYFHIFATPGKRTLSTESEFSDNSLEVNLEAGKSHYVRNYMKMGVFIGGANLEVVADDEAKKAIVESCKLAEPVSSKVVY
jgi:uncharacterized protein YceK